jgi:hypothetical protein
MHVLCDLAQFSQVVLRPWFTHRTLLRRHFVQATEERMRTDSASRLSALPKAVGGRGVDSGEPGNVDGEPWVVKGDGCTDMLDGDG